MTARTMVGPLAAGFLFAWGLGLSGMTQPAKILAFLDVAGAWDPTLAFVMVGAIVSHALLAKLLRDRLAAPLYAAKYFIPTRSDLDAPLIAGSALFGIGWGLGGFCPGPALVSLASGSIAVVVFTGGMLVGMALFELPGRSPTRPPSPVRPATTPATEGNDG